MDTAALTKKNLNLTHWLTEEMIFSLSAIPASCIRDSREARRKEGMFSEEGELESLPIQTLPQGKVLLEPQMNSCGSDPKVQTGAAGCRQDRQLPSTVLCVAGAGVGWGGAVLTSPQETPTDGVILKAPSKPSDVSNESCFNN